MVLVVRRHVDLALEESVRLVSNSAPLIDSPNNQTLATTAISRSEDSLNIRAVFAVFSMDVLTMVQVQAQLQALAGAESYVINKIQQAQSANGKVDKAPEPAPAPA